LLRQGEQGCAGEPPTRRPGALQARAGCVRKPGLRAGNGSARVAAFQGLQQLGLLPLQLRLALPRGAQARGLAAGDVVEHALGALAGTGLEFGLQPQAFGLFGLDLRLDAQALRFGAGAGGVLAAGLDQQFVALAVEAVDLPPGLFGGRGDFGDLHAPLGELAGVRLGLRAARRDQGVDGLARAQALVGGQRTAFGIGVQCPQAGLERGAAVIGRPGLLRQRGTGEHQGGRQRDDEEAAHGRSSMPRLCRREATSARRWASVASAWVCALRAVARSADASERTARARASRSLPALIAAWARLSAVRARSRSSGAYCCASAASARATAWLAAESSAVGG